jgi:hypothetical protein
MPECTGTLVNGSERPIAACPGAQPSARNMAGARSRKAATGACRQSGLSSCNLHNTIGQTEHEQQAVKLLEQRAIVHNDFEEAVRVALAAAHPFLGTLCRCVSSLMHF